MLKTSLLKNHLNRSIQHIASLFHKNVIQCSNRTRLFKEIKKRRISYTVNQQPEEEDSIGEEKEHKVHTTAHKEEEKKNEQVPTSVECESIIQEVIQVELTELQKDIKRVFYIGCIGEFTFLLAIGFLIIEWCKEKDRHWWHVLLCNVLSLYLLYFAKNGKIAAMESRMKQVKKLSSLLPKKQ
jgi:hypothetical protein